MGEQLITVGLNRPSCAAATVGVPMRVRRTFVLLLVAGSLLAAGCGSSSSSSSSSAAAPSSSSSSGSASSSGQAQIGFEGVPIEQGAEIAPASTTQTGTVDGIRCGPTEQLAYHIHAHLSIYVNGEPRALPGGIGIPGSQEVQTSEGPVAQGGQCIYWLHTHAPDGVVHVESPTERIYTLGNFFDEWHQPLSSNQVGDAKGKVTAIVNGKPWTKDPRDIPLDPHNVIQLNVGSPQKPFQSMSWSGLQL
jgi:hypothetical protein